MVIVKSEDAILCVLNPFQQLFWFPSEAFLDALEKEFKQVLSDYHDLIGKHNDITRLTISVENLLKKFKKYRKEHKAYLEHLEHPYREN